MGTHYSCCLLVESLRDVNRTSSEAAAFNMKYKPRLHFTFFLVEKKSAWANKNTYCEIATAVLIVKEQTVAETFLGDWTSMRSGSDKRKRGCLSPAEFLWSAPYCQVQRNTQRAAGGVRIRRRLHATPIESERRAALCASLSESGAAPQAGLRLFCGGRTV